MPKKYAKLVIHIPIEIYETGDYQIFEDRTTMQVEPCAELPPVYKSDRDSVLDVLTNMLLPKEKMKWTKEEEEEDFEKDEADTEDEEDEENEENEDSEEEEENTKKEEEPKTEETQKKEEPKKEEEIRIFSHEINNKKLKKGNVMSFKKHRHFKDNFTRRIRLDI